MIPSFKAKEKFGCFVLARATKTPLYSDTSATHPSYTSRKAHKARVTETTDKKKKSMAGGPGSFLARGGCSPYMMRWHSANRKNEVMEASQKSCPLPMSGQAKPLREVCRRNFSSAPRESQLGEALLQHFVFDISVVLGISVRYKHSFCYVFSL